MAQLDIKERRVGNVTILDLSGKILIGEGDSVLRSAVRGALEAGKSKILLNMKDVSTLDSAGLGEMVSSYSTTTNRGGQLKLLNVNQKVTMLLQITQLITVFQTFDDEKEAVESFL